jgi:hypothetical protein
MGQRDEGHDMGEKEEELLIFVVCFPNTDTNQRHVQFAVIGLTATLGNGLGNFLTSL